MRTYDVVCFVSGVGENFRLGTIAVADDEKVEVREDRRSHVQDLLATRGIDLYAADAEPPFTKDHAVERFLAAVQPVSGDTPEWFVRIEPTPQDRTYREQYRAYFTDLRGRDACIHIAIMVSKAAKAEYFKTMMSDTGGKRIVLVITAEWEAGAIRSRFFYLLTQKRLARQHDCT